MEGNQMPWKSPCGQKGNGLKLTLPPNTADRSWIKHFIIVLEETNDYFTELKRLYYLDEKVQRLINRCGHLDSDFQHLVGFPTVDPTRINNPAELNISLEIIDDYQKLATVFVFVEQIVWEKDIFRGINDLDILCNIYHKIKDALCELRTKSQETLIDKVTPTRNVMNSEYRIVSRIGRLQRNYIIFKDASRYLRAISNKYIRLYFQS
ncbi:unnamed protein product [Mytilus coruscus]|uniref:Uncharacterized protein n=1 Tax=Mytilus coruscus TaxID=42192 RepID=A0A6J8EVJ4_MYTCO|nr:unnamed protein product [Mytilus coruscus]